MRIKYSGPDRFLLILNAMMLTLAVLLVVLPLLYVVVASFMDPSVLLSQGLSFRVSDWTLDGYQKIVTNPAMVRGFGNAVLYSVSFSLITVIVSVFAGYALSESRLKGRGFFMNLFLITLFFGGGLVPTYLLVKNLGLIDTIWAVIIPGAVNVWNIILSRTFFKGVPHELKEAANVDGASEMKIFFQIVFPLSKPVLATVALFIAVGQWNSWFDSMLYTAGNRNLTTLQYELMKLLSSATSQGGTVNVDQYKNVTSMVTPVSIRAAITIVTAMPIILLYPFLQKYFVTGLTIGGVKE